MTVAIAERIEFFPRHELETDPEARIEIRAKVPAMFKAEDKQGNEWFQTPARTAVSSRECPIPWRPAG
jgi:hypothetical protein